MSDYLWDKAGEPDPEIERLETLLAPLAYRRRPTPPPPRRRTPRAWIAAALVASAAVVALLAMRPWRPKPNLVPSGASWAANVAGADATVDGHPIAGAARLAVGAWLETGSGHAELRVADIGAVELGPHTRARIVASGGTRHQLRLDRGTLSARIDAPPRQFLVETPRALVTDLGCAFTLAVDEAGQGRLTVTAGEVALAGGAAAGEVVVPAGAECAITARGPGMPHRSDASAGFRAALARYAEDPSSLPALLAEARPQDRVTLRALLASAGAAEQGLLQKRMSELEGTDKPAPKPQPQPTPPTAKRSTHKSTKRPVPARHVAPVQSSAPATKPAVKPDNQLHHDALKDMERSMP